MLCKDAAHHGGPQGEKGSDAEALAPSPSADPEDARLYRQPSGAVSLDPKDAALYRQEAAPAPSSSLDPEDAELYHGPGLVSSALKHPVGTALCKSKLQL